MNDFDMMFKLFYEDYLCCLLFETTCTNNVLTTSLKLQFLLYWLSDSQINQNLMHHNTLLYLTKFFLINFNFYNIYIMCILYLTMFQLMLLKDYMFKLLILVEYLIIFCMVWFLLPNLYLTFFELLLMNLFMLGLTACETTLGLMFIMLKMKYHSKIKK